MSAAVLRDRLLSGFPLGHQQPARFSRLTLYLSMQSFQPPARYEPDEAHQIRRIAYRASYDAAVVHAILDSAYVCHIAFVDAGAPQVIPMSYWRDGEFVYFHSGARGRFARVCREERVAISVTVMDGLV